MVKSKLGERFVLLPWSVGPPPADDFQVGPRGRGGKADGRDSHQRVLGHGLDQVGQANEGDVVATGLQVGIPETMNYDVGH